MSLVGIVAAGRTLAESLMADACTIKRRTGTSVDPDTGQEVATFGPPFYMGPCRVRMLTGTAADVNVAEGLSSQTNLVVYVPASSDPAQADDVVTVTASADPALLGRELRVESFYGQTHSVERRYVCEESTTPDMEV